MIKKFIAVLCILTMQFASIAGFEANICTAAGNSTNAFVMAAAGGSHVIALKKDGTVWSWGSNESGQLGDGTTKNKSKPVQVTGLKNVIYISAGDYSGYALKRDGTVWSWGNNHFGQIGDGSNQNKSKPVQISGLNAVKFISASNHSAVALKKDGTVWCWGNNEFGQLGDGTKTNRSKPVQAKGVKNAVSVASGGFHTLVLQKNGTVFAWGKNNDGQLGDGTNADKKTPVKVVGLNNVKAIAAGGTNNLEIVNGNIVLSETGHSAAIKNDGTVWCWGQNDSGQLGDGTYQKRNKPVCSVGLNNVSSVSSSGFHMLALKKDGTLWSWGNNQSGQLGDGTDNDSNKPLKVNGISGIKNFAAGGGSCTRYQNNGVQVSSVGFTIIIKSSGNITGWGDNESGQLGDGTTKDKTAPVKGIDGKIPSKSAEVKNKPPQISNIKVHLNDNGYMNVEFDAFDPEGKAMSAQCSIVDAYGNELSWSKSLSSCPSPGFKNSTVSTGFGDSELRKYLTPGTAYKVCINLIDADNMESRGFSNVFTYVRNEPPKVSDIKTLLSSTGGLDVTFTAFDPENEAMIATCFIVDSRGNSFSWSKMTRTTQSNVYNNRVTITIPNSVMNAYLTGGTSYKICVELSDTKGVKAQEYSDTFVYTKNKPPEISNVKTLLNADGSLTVSFTANDPEGQSLNADCFIVNTNNADFSWSNSTKVTQSGAKFSGTITVTFPKSILKTYLKDGNMYKIRVDLYDSEGGKVQGYSEALTFNLAAGYSGTNTLIIQNKVNFNFTACVYYNTEKIKEISIGAGGSETVNNLPNGNYYIIFEYGYGNTFKGNDFTLNGSYIYTASLEYVK